MNKETFIHEIRDPLKVLGYRKNGNYWYKKQNDLLLCIFVQGSQWDKNDYYVEIGAAIVESDRKFPTLLHWEFSHRCVDFNRKQNRDVNISPEVLLSEIQTIFADLTDSEHLFAYYLTHHTVKVGDRYFVS